jgi:hypothetical protein
MPKKKEKEKTRGNIILFLRHFGPRRNNLPPRTVVPKAQRYATRIFLARGYKLDKRPTVHLRVQSRESIACLRKLISHIQ